MSLETTDTLELQDRFGFLLEQYANASLELASKLEKFGKIRSELQLIVAELKKRGQKAEASEELKKKVEDSLKDFYAQNNPNERPPQP